jgi:hypothetical protein
MRLNCKLAAFFILGTYFVVSFYTGYLLIVHRLEKSSYDLQRIRALTGKNRDSKKYNTINQ